MAANKELLTDILDGITVVHTFLQQGLSQESLSQNCQLQRKNVSMTIGDMIDKIRHAHPSIRPRVNTPGGLKKPPHPAPSKGPAPLLPEEQEELYEEPTADPPMPTQQVDSQAEDYLSFEPAHPMNIDEGEEPQEMYEAMAVMEDQDLYEEPATQENADTAENYEDPVLSSTSLPQYSQENSGAEYAETMPQCTLEPSIEMSMDWSNVYTTPPKAEKMKVSTIKNISIKGYLDKLGGRNHKTWQRRYCVLAGPLMYFYEKESSKSYNNCIALLSFTESEAPNMTNEKKHQFGFKLTHVDSNTGKKKDYYFRTTSQDTRGKWLSCIAKLSKTVLSSAQNSFSTMPRGMPSHTAASGPPRKRTHSEGEEEGEGEMYEDMAIPEEEEDQGEYVAVSPAENHGNIELESSEEYVDVVPQHDVEQEEYEDTSAFQQPPPPLSPPPGPPSEVFTPALSLPPKPAHSEAPKAPAPPPPVEVDTSRVYAQPCDISLEKVFVSLWDFTAGESDELALHRGDLVYVSSPLSSEEWWFGEALDPEASKRLGPVGFFPQKYSTIAFEPTA